MAGMILTSMRGLKMILMRRGPPMVEPLGQSDVDYASAKLFEHLGHGSMPFVTSTSR